MENEQKAICKTQERKVEMYIKLTDAEKNLLKNKNINFEDERDFSEEEAEELLDKVRDVEIYYSQRVGTDGTSIRLYKEYGNLADKIQDAIDEN